MHKGDIAGSLPGTAADVHVGARLKLARERIGEAPHVIAENLKLSPVDYLELEAGLRRANAEVLVAAAEFFKLDIGWFFEGLCSHVSTPPLAEAPDIIDLTRARFVRKGT